MRAFLFSGDGRLDRLGYLLGLLAAALLFCIPVGLFVPSPASAWMRAVRPALYDQAVIVLGTACWALTLWIYCAVTARRLHDVGRSGWLALAGLIPAVGLGALTLALLALKGDEGPNRYGSRWL